MPRVAVTFDEMSCEEAKAWVHAVAEKYGSDIVMECLKERERRFEVTADKLPEIERQTNEA